ncbi:ion channel TACAN-like [Gambusia affinis]|uniref:ion channel TACAN-like n=1 Tax=Gambusia affinis TaxID=33528 RepID=UPI001CDCE0A0|nr:ion channel TACAN-like [Gambusia affinis]XP_043996980.1 ion channel TACAN-like [Gambusia affinis]XP_043996981.1 ion channel TACAN-like [Gambusia affinis]XP_043996982.1 ion channel TACAN-like [Gambusia affinis]XP_043996983.1 ion channel TACAN-like [Gambusia affinis]XP_043996984.1 ion channel TACAN-like [Gambusia affinis]XP_043996985.1 ion channel TACAN-like [Gambusia affinis]XP_043996986.1 ion channel TACAN-like [Gambusia affinis]
MLVWAAENTEFFPEWEKVEKDYKNIQDNYRLYKEELEENAQLERSCSRFIEEQRKNLEEISFLLMKYKQNHRQLSPEQRDYISVMEEFIKERRKALFEMEADLPKKNRLYHTLVLGNIHLRLLSKQQKCAYKGEYEKLKRVLRVILFVFSFTCRFLFSFRTLDDLFNFLLVWYYCTLTIRESILISNGSRIRDWWVFHHFVSIFLSGVMLTWPDGDLYQMFRDQYLSYNLYQSFVQFVQYCYQSGCLYQHKVPGETHNMDLTVEGFQPWMWRLLIFLPPVLFLCNFWELYNSITLFKMSQLPEHQVWQVLMSGCSYLVLFFGNLFNTLGVIYQNHVNNKDKPNAV